MRQRHLHLISLTIMLPIRVARVQAAGGRTQAMPSLQRALLVVPSTVLCSEMGVHIAPCGRYLAACVALSQVCFQAACGLHKRTACSHGSLHTPACFLCSGGSTAPDRMTCLVTGCLLEDLSGDGMAGSADSPWLACCTTLDGTRSLQ